MPIEMNMVYKRAYHYAKITGQEVEDLIQEGVIACIEAEQSFDPIYGAKLSTWQWWQIERRLKHYCYKQENVTFRTPVSMDDPDLDLYLESTEPLVTEAIFFQQYVLAAPADVQVICRTILDTPEDFAGLPQRKCMGIIRERMQRAPDPGWTHVRLNEAIRDCKTWFRNAPTEMRRTISGSFTRTLWAA